MCTLDYNRFKVNIINGLYKGQSKHLFYLKVFILHFKLLPYYRICYVNNVIIFICTQVYFMYYTDKLWASIWAYSLCGARERTNNKNILLQNLGTEILNN